MIKKTHKLLFAASLIIFEVNADNVSPYINKVFEFCPAPGQFVNEAPEYENGDTYETILEKVEEQLKGHARGGLVSLGAWGGYITFGFDHTIKNQPGGYDFRVNGNAIVSDLDSKGGSCEPGIIMVSADTNGNGLPDDEWYEIKGSEYDNPLTIHNYSITYYKPGPNHQATPDPSDRHIVDAKYIRWSSNDSSNPEGYVQRNDQHDQSYWPLWLDENIQELSFSGACIPGNAFDVSGNGTYFLLKMLGEGYADNYPSVESHGLLDPGINIEWAVKTDGTPANLTGIDFVRVYTAMNQTCGWIGETSTEISGAEDLHISYSTGVNTHFIDKEIVFLGISNNSISFRSGSEELLKVELFDYNGRKIKSFDINKGENTFLLNGISKGIYLLKLPYGTIHKIII